MIAVPDIQRSTAGGMTWSMFATVGGRALTLLSVAVLARLLTPADFGVVAIALVFIGYAEAIGDLGTGAALVHWPRRWRHIAQITFVSNLVMGLLWFAIAVLLAPAVARFFGSPDGVGVLQALALTFPIKALGNTHDALLQRELRFRARAIPELSLLAAKAAVAIPLAIAGYGVWSLVWGQLIGQAIWTITLWIIVPWRPARTVRRDLLAPVARYGGGIVSVNVLAAVVHHIDVVIVGRIFGVVALGFYQMADKLPDVVVTLPVRAASKVLFPVFSRLHAGGMELRRMYTDSLRYLALLTTPAAIGLLLLAQPIVLVAFGPQWLPSVPILRALAVYAGLRAISASAGDLLKAVGRPAVLAQLALVRAVVLVPALLLATKYGPAGVATTLAIVSAVATLMNVVVACRHGEVPLVNVAGALAPGMLSACAMAVALTIALPALAPLPPLVQVTIGIPLGIGVHLAAVRVVSPGTWHEIMRAISSVTRARTPASSSKLAEATTQ